MIRVLTVDDHPAMSAGLEAVLDAEPGITVVGVARDQYELWPSMHRLAPDVVVLDHHLPGESGLLLAHRIKSLPVAPRVLVYSAYADDRLAQGAVVAGADGIVHKHAAARELTHAIRVVASGDRVWPDIDDEARSRLRSELGPGDWDIVAMLLDGVARHAVAARMGISPAALHERVEQIVLRIATQPLTYAA